MRDQQLHMPWALRPNRFLQPSALRSGQQGALGKDLLDLLDALQIERATLVGYDWGGRAACIVAACVPEARLGLVEVRPVMDLKGFEM